MAARPKLTPEVRARILELFRKGLGLYSVSIIVDVSHQAIVQSWKRDPDWKAECDRCRDYASDLVVSALFKNAMKGNVVAQIFWLKNQRPLEWRDKHDIEQNNATVLRIIRETAPPDVPIVPMIEDDVSAAIRQAITPDTGDDAA